MVVIYTLWADSESQGRGQASSLAHPHNIQQYFLYKGPGKPMLEKGFKQDNFRLPEKNYLSNQNL